MSLLLISCFPARKCATLSKVKNNTWSSTLTEQRSFHSSMVCAKSTMHNGTLCKQSVSILYYLIIDQLRYNQPIQERYVDNWSLAWIWGDIFPFVLLQNQLNWVFWGIWFHLIPKFIWLSKRNVEKKKKLSEIEKLLPFEEAQMEKVW